jgi:hypothetical protein
MDHDLIVEQLIDQCKCFLENILQTIDLHRVAAASLAIFVHIRDVGRPLLQANVALEAQPCRGQAVPHGCQRAEVRYVHARTVGPMTRFGVITIPVRTFECQPTSLACVRP